MRAAPRRIPTKLPDAAQAVRSIQREVLDRPDTRLTDLSIGQLVLELGDGTPIYLTGSNVWYRSVFGGVPGCPEVCRRATRCLCSQLDYDLVLSSEESAEAFVERVLCTLNRRLPSDRRFTRETNSFGNGRIVHPDGRGIIDAWALGEGESIGELLLGYPELHQRSALHVSRSVSAGSLFRIVRADAELTLVRNDRLRRATVTRYPG